MPSARVAEDAVAWDDLEMVRFDICGTEVADEANEGLLERRAISSVLCCCSWCSATRYSSTSQSAAQISSQCLVAVKYASKAEEGSRVYCTDGGEDSGQENKKVSVRANVTADAALSPTKPALTSLTT